MQPLEQAHHQREMPDDVPKLAVHRLPEIVESLESDRIRGPQADLFARLEVNAAGQGELNGGGQIVVPARSPLGGHARNVRFDAAVQGPVTGRPRGYPLAHDHHGAHIVAVDGGKARTGLHALRNLMEKLFRILAAEAHGQRRLRIRTWMVASSII